MMVIEDLKSETINKEVLKGVEKSSRVLTDGYTGYSQLKEIIAMHYMACGTI
jgi:hypothetical protein